MSRESLAGAAGILVLLQQQPPATPVIQVHSDVATVTQVMRDHIIRFNAATHAYVER